MTVLSELRLSETTAESESNASMSWESSEDRDDVWGLMAGRTGTHTRDGREQREFGSGGSSRLGRLLGPGQSLKSLRAATTHRVRLRLWPNLCLCLWCLWCPLAKRLCLWWVREPSEGKEEEEVEELTGKEGEEGVHTWGGEEPSWETGGEERGREEEEEDTKERWEVAEKVRRRRRISPSESSSSCNIIVSTWISILVHAVTNANN